MPACHPPGVGCDLGRVRPAANRNYVLLLLLLLHTRETVRLELRNGLDEPVSLKVLQFLLGLEHKQKGKDKLERGNVLLKEKTVHCGQTPAYCFHWIVLVFWYSGPGVF